MQGTYNLLPNTFGVEAKRYRMESFVHSDKKNEEDTTHTQTRKCI